MSLGNISYFLFWHFQHKLVTFCCVNPFQHYPFPSQSHFIAYRCVNNSHKKLFSKIVNLKMKRGGIVLKPKIGEFSTVTNVEDLVALLCEREWFTKMFSSPSIMHKYSINCNFITLSHKQSKSRYLIGNSWTLLKMAAWVFSFMKYYPIISIQISRDAKTH